MTGTVIAWLVAFPIAVLAVLFGITPLVDTRRQRLLRQALLDICDVFNAHGVDYWCDFGTLLGIYRDHDVIRSDYDVDLCLLADEKPKLLALAPALERRGYTLTDSNGTTKLVVRIANDRTGHYADVYVYRPDEAMLRSTFRSVEDVPAALTADRVDMPFLGGVVRVPRDIEPLLLHRYGPSYKVPRRGDQGLAYGYSRVQTAVRILEHNCLGLWSFVRSIGR